MRAMRSSLDRWVPWVLAAFAASLASPHAAVVVHQHAGGEHAHVHLNDEVGEPHDHDDHELDGHAHHHHVAGAPGPVEIEEADGHGLLHVHWHHPYHRAALPLLVPLVLVAAVKPGSTVDAVEPSRQNLPATQARGPPGIRYG
jgi:hypothetical protein